jgi:predicted phosphatase
MPYPHVYITLTPEERQLIKTELQRLVTLKKWKKRKPLQALYLSDQKKIFQDIANYLGVSYMTVRRWIYRYRKNGLNTFILQSRNNRDFAAASQD